MTTSITALAMPRPTTTPTSGPTTDRLGSVRHLQDAVLLNVEQKGAVEETGKTFTATSTMGAGPHYTPEYDDLWIQPYVADDQSPEAIAGYTQAQQDLDVVNKRIRLVNGSFDDALRAASALSKESFLMEGCDCGVGHQGVAVLDAGNGAFAIVPLLDGEYYSDGESVNGPDAPECVVWSVEREAVNPLSTFDNAEIDPYNTTPQATSTTISAAAPEVLAYVAANEWVDLRNGPADRAAAISVPNAADHRNIR